MTVPTLVHWFVVSCVEHDGSFSLLQRHAAIAFIPSSINSPLIDWLHRKRRVEGPACLLGAITLRTGRASRLHRNRRLCFHWLRHWLGGRRGRMADRHRTERIAVSKDRDRLFHRCISDTAVHSHGAEQMVGTGRHSGRRLVHLFEPGESGQRQRHGRRHCPDRHGHSLQRPTHPDFIVAHFREIAALAATQHRALRAGAGDSGAILPGCAASGTGRPTVSRRSLAGRRTAVARH